jgi:hypothetical protein
MRTARSASDIWVGIGTATLLCDIVSSAARFLRGKRRAELDLIIAAYGRSSTVRPYQRIGALNRPLLRYRIKPQWGKQVRGINMIHITPWAASKGLMTGAERTGGVRYLYGPYQINGRHTAQSNQEFDAWLRTQNAEWGVRDIAEVTSSQLLGKPGAACAAPGRSPLG